MVRLLLPGASRSRRISATPATSPLDSENAGSGSCSQPRDTPAA